MHNDLKQLREGAEMILNTALEENGVIDDFVFVPFHDPAVGPATVTRDKEVFKATLDRVYVYGGGDCPEKSLGGIQLALNVSKPRSYVYVFTDATAKDHSLVGKLLDAVQRKQTQVVFILTGHCKDVDRPNYKVYQQIAAASSGQVFNLNKTSVHKVLEFVRSSIRGRTVNLGSSVNPPGFNTQGIPIDSNLGEVTVSVSGSKPSIKVVNPSGTEVTGPPQLVTTLDLSEIMVVKVLQPEPGNWTITTGSEDDHSVKVVGVSNLGFNHGFSVVKPTTVAETSYRPLQGAYNYMVISLTQTNSPVQIEYAEILSLNGTLVFEVPLKLIDSERKLYLAEAFVPPDEMFYIAINGHDENNQYLRRMGVTAVQAKSPDAPYLTVPKTVEGRAHQSVTLNCNIESLVPVTAMWTKNNIKLQPQISSLQSTSIQYVINDMSEEKAGTYRCVVKNIAGVSQAATEVILLVDPPQVIITPENRTVDIGTTITISCSVISDVLLLKHELIFNGSLNEYVMDIHLDPSIDGLYSFNKTISNASERDNGVYSCVAANRAGQTIQSTQITIKTIPSVQILGPHTLTKLKNSDIQLVCRVENAERLLWIAPNGTIVKEIEVNGSVNDMFDMNVIGDGVWSCVGIRGGYNDTDSVSISVVIKPEVTIEGAKNISVVNGTQLQIICNVLAKPKPRILWHRETENFLNNTISILEPNVYRSVLSIDSAKENVKGTYFCFGENSEGIHQDSVTVSVRRKMQLIQGFQDLNVQLYTQIALPCKIDSYPPPTILWYHNGTNLQINENLYLSENNNTLYILKVGFEDLGGYACEADNGFEKLKVEGSLNVDGLESPVLSKEPVQRLTQEGKSTILTCRVLKGNPAPSIVWQHRNVTNTLYTVLPDGVIANQNNTELIITKVQRKHWGIYRCIAENVIGRDVYDVALVVQCKCIAENVIGRDVYDVALVVQYPPKLKSKSPTEEVLLEVGKKVTLSCEATGIPPPLVTWRKNNQPVGYSKNVYLTDANDLVIEKVTVDDSGIFTCNATSILGSSQRNFTVNVYAPPKIAPPLTNSEIEVLEGDLVELACNAQGMPKPRVEWLQNGEIVRDGRKRIDEFGLRFVANLTDFGEYTCIASNQYGNTTFKYSVLIWVPPSIEPPLVTTKNVLLGADISLECNVVGFPIPIVYWEVNGRLLQKNTTDLSFNEYGTLNITNTTAERAGLYTCIAENIAGVAKKSTYLKVNEAPKIIRNDFEGPYIATTDDTHLVISCHASGVPKPYMVWYKDNKYIDKDSRYDIDVDGTLTIKVLSEDLSGRYTCVAKNSVGTDNKTVTVEIYSGLINRMQADESQTSINVLEGTNATFDCPIRTSNTDTVKWYKDAKLVSTENQLQILNITRQNASTYACVVTNVIGSSYSNIIVNVEWPPRFIDTKSDAEVIRGDDWYFDCGADAKPQAKTKWLFNTKPLIGEDNERLVLLNIQQRHAGVYKCIISNAHGTVTKQFKLDVVVPPSISQFELLDVQLKAGTNATLECNAEGAPAPNITWKYNNTNLYQHNSSLILHNITQESEGIYCCIAQNKAGVARLAYRVTVTAPAKIQEVVIFENGVGATVLGVVEVLLGTNIRLSCKATGHPAPTIHWLLGGSIVGQNGDGISYADLILVGIKAGDSGDYTCAVSNDGGMDERTIKLDVLGKCNEDSC
ncbi:immunoglobulin domain-containing protein [Phthorimaea operculella]|nr:immunoglobulin domain-containing protein [Phthorimaea operculella]